MDLSAERAALVEAVEIAGGQTKLGKEIGKSQAHVWHWLNKGRLPPELVLKVSEVTGVSKHRLRPDIYPIDQVMADTPSANPIEGNAA